MAKTNKYGGLRPARCITSGGQSKALLRLSFEASRLREVSVSLSLSLSLSPAPSRRYGQVTTRGKHLPCVKISNNYYFSDWRFAFGPSLVTLKHRLARCSLCCNPMSKCNFFSRNRPWAYCFGILTAAPAFSSKAPDYTFKLGVTWH